MFWLNSDCVKLFQEFLTTLDANFGEWNLLSSESNLGAIIEKAVITHPLFDNILMTFRENSTT